MSDQENRRSTRLLISGHLIFTGNHRLCQNYYTGTIKRHDEFGIGGTK